MSFPLRAGRISQPAERDERDEGEDMVIPTLGDPDGNYVQIVQLAGRDHRGGG
jgi:hypothetical protein